MSLRILQIMNRVPWPLKDGGSLGFYNNARGYADAGCDLTICALNTRKHYFPLEQLPEPVRNMADWRTADINTDVTIPGALRALLTGRSYNLQRFISGAFEALLLRTLQEKQFDVIVCESLFVAHYIGLVRQHSDALVVLHQYNVEHEIWEKLAAADKNPFRSCYLRILASQMKKAERKYLDAADAVNALTEQDAEVFRQLGCTKPICVTPVGLELETKSIAVVPEPYSIFHLGSMEWMPNRQALDWFVKEVWPRVIAAKPEASLYLAGRGMQDEKLFPGLPNVHVVGEVEDAAHFMQSKNIMIVPLLAGSGIRVKILEGMAMGKAIVSTSLGAQGIECDNGRHLFLADTAEDFAAAVLRLLQDPGLGRVMGQQAQELVKEKFDNTKVITRVLDFYKTQVALKRA